MPIALAPGKFLFDHLREAIVAFVQLENADQLRIGQGLDRDDLIARCMRSEDERAAVMAANVMLERGYGKAEQHSDVEINHRFVIAPQTMSLDRWLANKGQPEPEPTPEDDPGRKLN